MTETSPAHTGVMNSLRRVIAASAHELNQPLNAISLLADNVLDELNDFGAGDRRHRVLSLTQRLERDRRPGAAGSRDHPRLSHLRTGAGGLHARPQRRDPFDGSFQRLFAKGARLLGVELEVVAADDRRCGVIDEWLLQLAMIELITAWGDRERPGGDAKAGVRIQYLDGEDGAPAALAVSGPAPLPASQPGSAIEAWGKARGCGTRIAQSGERVTVELLLPDAP